MLENYKYTFSPGLNPILLDNGEGKTTLSVFIKAMFYGIGDTRVRDLDENDRKKYMPWRGGVFGGSLTFEWGGRMLRVERTFGQKAADDTVRVVDGDSGTLLPTLSDSLGEKIFEIDRDGFERTIFLSEKNLSGKIENSSIATKLSDLVGSDGATGAYEIAKKKLENERRVYQKKGGGGEIADIEARILECDRSLIRCAEAERLAGLEEAKMRDLAERIAELLRIRGDLEARLLRAREEISLRGKREQYASMLHLLEGQKKKLAEYDEFFTAGVPDNFEIDEARDAWREAEKLARELETSESGELTELRGFFARETDFSEIAKIEDAVNSLDMIEQEENVLSQKMKLGKDTLEAEFGGKIPKLEDIDRYIKEGKSIKKPLFMALAACGIVVAVLGILFGILASIPALYVLAVLGVAMFVAGVTLGGGKITAGEKYAHSLGLESHAMLIPLRERILQHYETLAEDEAKISEYAERRETLSRDCESFLGSYNHGIENRHEAIIFIKTKFERYYKLKLTEEQAREGDRTREARRVLLHDKAKRFLSKYPTKEDEPFEEIREKLSHRKSLEMSIRRATEDTERFRIESGINLGEVVAGASDDDIAKLEALLLDNREEIDSVKASRVSAENAYNAYQQDVERIDEIEAEKARLTEKLEVYRRNFETIKATLALLTEACESMTAKYIGGTRQKFREYIEMMGMPSEGYSVDTNFVVRKFEDGETRATESYSRGTRDLYALALRLALVDSLYAGESPFLVLDDPFTYFDGARLYGAKELLRQLSEKKQIIYFTCSRERSI